LLAETRGEASTHLSSLVGPKVAKAEISAK